MEEHLEKLANYVKALEDRNAYLEEQLKMTETQKVAELREQLEVQLKEAGVKLPDEHKETYEKLSSDPKTAAFLQELTKNTSSQPTPMGSSRTKLSSAPGNDAASSLRGWINS